MSPLNRKAGDRRLVDMSAAAELQRSWAPDLPSEPEESLTQVCPLSEHSQYVQRLGYDEKGRLVEWAVVQKRLRNDRWQRVAVYDISHDKGVHVHLFNRQEEEFTEDHLRSVTSYKDVEDGLDYVLHRLIDLGCWQENERRSDRGY